HRWIHARSRSEQRQLILQITPLLPGKARDGAIHGAPCIRCMAGCARSVETDAFGCGKCRLRYPESRHGQKARGKSILELLTMVFHGGSLIKLPTLRFKGIHLPRGTSGTCVEGFQLEVSKKKACCDAKRQDPSSGYVHPRIVQSSGGVQNSHSRSFNSLTGENHELDTLGTIQRCRYFVQPVDARKLRACRAGRKRQEARLVAVGGHQ